MSSFFFIIIISVFFIYKNEKMTPCPRRSWSFSAPAGGVCKIPPQKAWPCPRHPLYLSAATSPKGTKIPTLPILKSLYTQLPCPVWLFLRMVLVKEWEFVQFSFLSLQCGWYPGITGLQDSVSTRIGSTSTAVVGFGCDYSKCLDEQFCRLDSESAEVSLDVLQCLSQVLHFHAFLLLSVLLLSPGDPAPLRLPALQQSCERGWRF